MKFNPSIHKRKSIRLHGYDYSQEGMYFITICTHNKECLFGHVGANRIRPDQVNNHDDANDENIPEMHLNEFGKIAHNEWLKTPEIRPNVELGEFMIMPNHMHGIIIIKNQHLQEGVLQYAPMEFKSPSHNIGAIIRGYKSAVTKQINILRESPEHAVWQRNYYEHIIRTAESYEKITNYIIRNPLLWEEDRFFTA